MTPALLAAQHGQADVLDYLIDNGCNPSTPEYSPPTEAGDTPLHMAAKFGGPVGLRMVERLLSVHATVDYKGSVGWSALTMAADNGQVEIAKRLLEAARSSAAFFRRSVSAHWRVRTTSRRD